MTGISKCLDVAQRNPYSYVPYDLSMTQPDIDLSIIILAYNEAERIPKTLKRFHDQFLHG